MKNKFNGIVLDERKLQALKEFIWAQAEEYQQRSRLYAGAAQILDDFSAGANSLTSSLHFHVHIVGFVQVAKAVLQQLNNNNGKESLTLLDCGCGIGTQALIFASLGYEVTGIDLNREFIDLANARIDFYSKRLGRPIPCQFLAKNIFKEPIREKYDVVWAREAISHIHPVENFLSQAYHSLRPGGILLISDANWANPFVKLELFRSYWKYYRPFRTWGEASIHYITERHDPETGELVPMAMERVLNLVKTIRKLREAGFTEISGQTVGILPKSTLAKFLSKSEAKRAELFDRLNRFEESLLRIPWLRRLGGTNVVVGKRG